MTIAIDRRRFLSATSAAFAGFSASGCMAATPGVPSADIYGPLLPDPGGLLDLPKGFSYRVISRFGNIMDDGYLVPSAGDGMGAIAASKGKVALVRERLGRDDRDFSGASAGMVFEGFLTLHTREI